MTDSIGARLREARELRRLTLQQVSESTKLRTYYLQALENDDHSAIPSSAQARGFLRLYAGFLGLDFDDLLSAATHVEPSAVNPSAPDAALTAAPPPRLSLLASLRQRVARRPNSVDSAQGSALSTPTGIARADAAQQPAAPQPGPASEHIQTTRRVKPRSTPVKKNAIN